MASADDYAKWIVANADKKGTPQFDTVVSAYKDARATGDAHLKQSQTAKPDVTEGMSQGQLALAGLGKSFVDTARGLGQMAGLVSDKDVAEARARDEALMRTGAGLAGNIGGQIGQAIAGGGALGAVGRGLSTIAPRAGQALQYVGQGLTSPANVKQAATGAATYSATQPVTSDESRLLNAVIGGAAGAAGSAIAGKITQKIGEKFGKTPEVHPKEAAQHAEDVVNKALQEVGQSANDLPVGYVDSLKNSVSLSLQKGQKLDPAAMLRKADFESLGIQGTTGQITRDPMAYARERNLRGIEGVGEPLLQRFGQQEETIRKGVSGLAAGSTEHQQAGTQLADTLAGIDEKLRQKVSSEYKAARESGAAGAEVNLTGLAQDYARIAHEFGDKLPSGVRNVLDDYGLMKGKQAKLMTVDDAEKVLNVINNNVGSDKATNTALGQLRTALKDAITSSTGDGGAFAGARKLAAERFALHDAIPALAKASQGEANADTFVKNYLISGQTKDVNKLASLLKQESPQGFDLARAQVGDYLQTAAFGVNPAGDAAFNAAAFTKAIKNLGTDKLKAFFSPEEIAQMKTIGRVGAYIHSIPNAAAVSTSSSGVPVTNALLGLAGSHIPGLNLLSSALGSVKNAAQRQALAKSALAGEVPAEFLPRGFSQNALDRARLIGGSSGIAGYEALR